MSAELRFPSEVKLQFPSQEAIVSYLDQHPGLKDSLPHLRNKKIIEAVAKVFAGKTLFPGGVDMNIELVFAEKEKELGMSEMALITMQMNLVDILKECGSGKKIEIKRNDSDSSTRSDVYKQGK